MSFYLKVAKITTEEQLTEFASQIPEGCLEEIEARLERISNAKPVPVKGTFIETHLNNLIKSQEHLVTCNFTEDQVKDLVEEFSKFKKIIEDAQSNNLESIVQQTQKERIKISLADAASEIEAGLSKLASAFTGKGFESLFDL